jgi:hypothetical protein
MAAPQSTTTTFTDNLVCNNTVWFIGGGNTACISSFSAGATFNNTVTLGNTGANFIQSNYALAGDTTLQVKGNFIFGGTGNANNGLQGTTLLLFNGSSPQTISWTNTTGGATPPIIYGNITFNNSQITITMTQWKHNTGTLTALTTVNASASTLALINVTATTIIACSLISGSNRWGGLSITSATGGGPYTPTFSEDIYCVNLTTGNSVGNNGGTNGAKNIYVSGNWNGSGGANFDTTTADANRCIVWLNGTGTQTWTTTGVQGTPVVINNSNVVVSGTHNRIGSITALTSATTTGSTLASAGNLTLNTSPMTWESISYSAAGGTLTLASNLYCVNFTETFTNTIAGSFEIQVSGNCSLGVITTSAANIRMTGTGTLASTGIWNVNSATGGFIIDSTGIITLNIGVNGIIRHGFFQYIKGEISHPATSILAFGGSTVNTTVTLDTNNFEWQGPVSFTGVVTLTLTSPFRYRGTSLALGTLGQPVTINGENLYTTNLTIGGTSSIISGTSKVFFDGTGTISSTQTTGYFGSSMDIDSSGVIDITTDFRYGTGTLTYKSGKIRQNGKILYLSNTSCTINGFNKTPLENVIIAPAGTMTVTMDSFFRGTPGKPCKVRSSSTNANFAVSFSDGFEKPTSHIKLERCTILSGNLLVLTDKSLNGTTSTPAIINSGNIGVRYINHSPNGIGKGLNHPPIRRYDLTGDYLVADPVYS